MKRSFFILVLAVLTLMSCAAPQVGVKAGVNMSRVSGDDADSFDSRTGLNVGLVAKTKVSDDFDVQTGLIFSQQGADYGESMYTGEYNLDYLNVPIMARFGIAEGLKLQAGPQLGFLLSATDKFNFDGGSGEEDVKDFTKSIDFGVNFGLGYEFQNGFGIDATYNLGLSNFADGDELSDVSWKHSIIQISLSYLFDIGGSNNN